MEFVIAYNNPSLNVNSYSLFQNNVRLSPMADRRRMRGAMTVNVHAGESYCRIKYDSYIQLYIAY